MGRARKAAPRKKSFWCVFYPAKITGRRGEVAVLPSDHIPQEACYVGYKGLLPWKEKRRTTHLLAWILKEGGTATNVWFFR